MSYTVTLEAKMLREQQIKNSVQSSKITHEFYDFRNTRNELPVIRIDIGLPIYRMENFRTYTDQKEYIANHSKQADFFDKGQESESSQQAQHDLLKALAKKGRADSIVPVIDVLRKEKQREPILISSSGVVINGNRRLAAMRELGCESYDLLKDFSHVDCMVLPDDATSKEILEIEASLQAKPETKLDYDWIGDSQLIKSLQENGHNLEEISEKLNRSQKEIENSIQALTEAEMYLNDWAQAPSEYRRIKDDAEQLFKDLPKRLEGKDTNLKEASRVIAWTLFDNRDMLPGRIYDFNPAFGKLASDVMERFSDSAGIESVITTSQTGEGLNDDLFDVDIDEDTISYEEIIQTLKNDESKEYTEALIEACQNAIETEKGQKSGEAALKLINQAHSKLVSVDISTASSKTYPVIKKQLKAISKVTEKLLDDLDKHSQMES